MDSGWVVAFGALVGAVGGLLTPWPAYRMSVEWQEPPAGTCSTCAGAHTGWVRVPSTCPSCGARQGPRLLWTIPVGALAGGLFAWALPAGPLLATALVICLLGVPLTAIDLAVLRLPNPIVLLAFVLTALTLTITAWSTGDWPALLRAAEAGAALYAVYLVIHLMPGSGMGEGDVKLMGVLGLFLGYLGWPLVVLGGIFLPFLLNGPYALVTLIRRGRKAVAPFGPALLAGTVVAVAAVRAFTLL